MIHKITYTKEWLDDLAKIFPKKDPGLVEKVVMALSLVEQIAKNEIPFIFKGGTSLLLILGDLFRFSIDVDIVVSPGIKILDSFPKIIDQGLFYRFDEDKRDQNNQVPKSHFKFYYKSHYKTMQEEYVMLDILYQDEPYKELLQKPVMSKILKTEEPYPLVQVPTVDGILGDKLNAFAPRTLGIQFGSRKELEINKQLFDIELLFDRMSSVSAVRESYHRTGGNAVAYYSDRRFSKEEVLADTFETCLIIGFQGTRERELFDELVLGLKKLEGYVPGGKFNLPQAIRASSKVAYLTKLLSAEGHESYVYFDESKNLSEMNIGSTEFNRLNKLKKINEEAFFYWYQAIQNI